MSQQKQEKCTASTTAKKHHQQNPFIQIEGKLTKAQLEAIASTTINHQQRRKNQC